MGRESTVANCKMYVASSAFYMVMVAWKVEEVINPPLVPPLLQRYLS